MARRNGPRIVTANDLLAGDAIYLTAHGTWSRDHGEAAVALTDEQAEALLGDATAQHDRIVGAYLAEVTVGPDGRPGPVHFREAFRTRGPSNYFHGKQAADEIAASPSEV